MTISFDFDETFTAAPELFASVMDVFRAAGWMVIVCTRRGDQRRPTAESVIDDRFAGSVPVVRARGIPKWQAAREAGFEVDVWVDDDPGSVLGMPNLIPRRS